MSTTQQLRLGTRGSLLARIQSQQVADVMMREHPGLQINLVEIRTTGDQVQSKPLHDIGGKGLFTREVEQALLAGEVDLAVHSMKDLPITQPLVDTEALVVAAIPLRQSVEDVIYSPAGHTHETLPAGSTVATGSLRRLAQWRSCRPDLEICPIRGNIDTRLRKVRQGEFDAVVLAAAGLNRAGLFDPATMKLLPPDLFVPAAGQGALAIQCRREDASTREILARLHDADAAICVQMERSIVEALKGDCHSPIAAWASISLAPKADNRGPVTATDPTNNLAGDLPYDLPQVNPQSRSANPCRSVSSQPTVNNEVHISRDMAAISDPVGHPGSATAVSLLATVAGRGGVLPIIRAWATGPRDQWKAVLQEVTDQLLSQDAMKLLHG